MESPDSNFRRRVKSDWFRYKLESQDLSILLPPGWKRHTIPIGHDTESFCGRQAACLYWYSHILIPNTKFYYPLPIPDKSAELIISPSTPFLFCNISFGVFYADGLVPPSDRGFFYTDHCSLRESSGSWAGILYPHSPQDNDHFLAHARPGEKVGLVAISRGHCSTDLEMLQFALWEPYLQEFPKDLANYEFYTVLWVEWINGVAYRKGLGRVLRETWERLKEDDNIDLILG